MKYRFYTNADAFRYQNCRLPSGFGTVRYLGPCRTNPYAVHPPMIITTEYKLKRPPAMCYVADRMTGIKVLILYHNGLYSPGLEKDVEALDSLSRSLFKRNKEYPDDGLTDHNMESDRHISQRKVLTPDDTLQLSEGSLSDSESRLQSLSEGWSEKNNMHSSADNTHRLTESGKKIYPLKSSGNTDKPGVDNETDEFLNSKSLFFSHYPWPVSLKKEFFQMMHLYLSYAVQEYSEGNPAADPRFSNTMPYKPNNESTGSTPNNLSTAYQTEQKAFHLKTSAQTKHTDMPELKEVYHEFFQFKYGEHAPRRLSRSSRNASEAAYRKLAPFYGQTLDEITIVDLQNLVNLTASQGYSRSSVTDLVTLIRQLYRFAYPREMCTREYGKYVLLPYTAVEKHHQAFSDKEIEILWKYNDDPVIGMVLIMCYSGFRISEFAPENGMQTVIDRENNNCYLQGGIKTEAGRDRIVPIHSAILPLIIRTEDGNGNAVYLCGRSTSRFRELMKKKLVEIGINTAATQEKSMDKPVSKTTSSDINASNELRYHTPHSCRHTFSRLCESYGVNEADRKRMMGHSFGNDITNGVYGHRSVQELALELEKIKAPT